MKKFDLKDKYVLITGASSGIGKEISRCLAEEGAHLVLSSLPAEKGGLEQWANDLGKRYHVKTWAVPVDLSEDTGPETLYQRAMDLVPHLDLLVNNAGIMHYGGFQDVPLANHDRLLRVNGRAYMILMHLVLPGMIARGTGRILNVSSMAAMMPCSYMAPYGAAKSFVQSLSEAVNLEVKKKGVLICTLNPNLTDTAMIKAFPKKIYLFKIALTRSPAAIAKKGVNYLKRGKQLCIPGVENLPLAHLLPRVVPRSWLGWLGYFLLKK